jgi:hypothetical protein
LQCLLPWLAPLRCLRCRDVLPSLDVLDQLLRPPDLVSRSPILCRSPPRVLLSSPELSLEEEEEEDASEEEDILVGEGILGEVDGDGDVRRGS